MSLMLHLKIYFYVSLVFLVVHAPFLSIACVLFYSVFFYVICVVLVVACLSCALADYYLDQAMAVTFYCCCNFKLK